MLMSLVCLRACIVELDQKALKELFESLDCPLLTMELMEFTQSMYADDELKGSAYVLTEVRGRRGVGNVELPRYPDVVWGWKMLPGIGGVGNPWLLTLRRSNDLRRGEWL